MRVFYLAAIQETTGFRPRGRNRPGFFMEPWLSAAPPGVRVDAACAVGGAILENTLSWGTGALDVIMGIVGPHARVGQCDQGQRSPWIHAWAEAAQLTNREADAEGLLDRLLEWGVAIDAVDDQGQRALECLDPGRELWPVPAGGRLVAQVSPAYLMGLLLERGAQWTDLEGRVSMAHWQVLTAHPAVRRERLRGLAGEGCVEPGVRSL